jgi:dipeptidyl aminopeptidase/acylaminoacyl peptidase
VRDDVSKTGAGFKRVVTHNREYLNSTEFGKVEEFWIQSTDKTRVHAFMFLPPKFSPRKKYPAVALCAWRPARAV